MGRLGHMTSDGLAQEKERRQLYAGSISEVPGPRRRTLHLCCMPEGLCGLAQSPLPKGDTQKE